MGKKAVCKINKVILEKIESQLPKTLNITRKELIIDIGKTCHKQLINNAQSRKIDLLIIKLLYERKYWFNKNIENCPEGTVLWSDNYGEVQFKCIIKSYNYYINYPILVKRTDGHNLYYTKEGWHDIYFPASCLLWHKNDKFNPKTLKPFDRV